MSIAKRAFPVLQQYPDERLVFEVCSTPPYDPSTVSMGGAAGRNQTAAQAPFNGGLQTNYPPSHAWSRIMDDAWDQFSVMPPGRLRVRLEDSASDIALREFPETWQLPAMSFSRHRPAVS